MQHVFEIFDESSKAFKRILRNSNFTLLHIVLIGTGHGSDTVSLYACPTAKSLTSFGSTSSVVRLYYKSYSYQHESSSQSVRS